MDARRRHEGRASVLLLFGMLLAAVVGVAAPANAAEVPVLAPGDRGEEVRVYQGALDEWVQYARPGYGRLRTDGIFGPRTEAATRELERASGVAVNGEADEETWRALYGQLGGRAAQVLDGSAVTAEWPLPVPRWFWPWARWYLHRGEFGDGGFRSASTRPDGAPARIPGWAWRRITALAGRGPVARADHFVEDLLQNRGGMRLRPGNVTVTPQRQSELAPGWILLTATVAPPEGATGQVAAWLRLVRGRWVPWEIGRLGDPDLALAPRLVPCDLKPAFAEALCPPTPGSGPGAVLEGFRAAARASDADRLFAMLAPATQARLGPLSRFRRKTAIALSEGLGSFPASTPLILATEVGSMWAVAALAGERTAEGTHEYGVYATALRRVDNAWRVVLGGPVAVEPLHPEPGADVARVERIALRAGARSGLEKLEVWLDGRRFPVEVGGPSGAEQTAFGQPREPLSRGRHVVVGFARTDESAVARAWTFTVSG